MPARAHFLLILMLAIPAPLMAAAAELPRPEGMEPTIQFWRRIFTDYSEYQLVLHDSQYPNKVYKVLDFRPLKRGGASPGQIAKSMNAAEKRERHALDRMFAKLDKMHTPPKPGQKTAPAPALSADERRLMNLYADFRHPRRFQAARGRVRAQRGLREHFEKAVTVSGRYLPHMERIFRDAGLPVELTRLPFVESSFNVEAYSKVGAAGIWQFIPSTARVYMRYDDIVDDRRDPLLSTEAAAKHLKDDYRALGSWPLAVTAYNHGRGGVAAAVRKTGSRNLFDLIHRYNAPNFGFATKNFYASFLGALDAYRDYKRYLGEVPVDRPLVFSTFTTRHYVKYRALQRISGLSPERFRELNPAYLQPVVDGKLLVPPRHKIRIAAGTRPLVQARYATLGPSDIAYAQRRYFREHKVARGQSLGGIARQYGVTVREIQSANNLGPKTRIRINQVLRIPPRSQPEKSAVAGAAPAKSAAPPQKPVVAAAPAQRKHRVSKGQTLDVIARRYNTSVKALLSANNIKDANRIREGQVLVIPSG